ncbi:hypothetical protein [Lysobacter gummosus]|uniref:hypothetical protein n=1 Tax=Lysobacter gummosus TaxID=262324 RepID=UPI00363BCDE9
MIYVVHHTFPRPQSVRPFRFPAAQAAVFKTSSECQPVPINPESQISGRPLWSSRSHFSVVVCVSDPRPPGPVRTSPQGG